jgi:hypothetical protein
MHKLLIAVGVFLAAATGAALAQDQGHGPGGMLMMADTNHDGAISRAEFDTMHAAHFTQMDANHDGSLQASERPQWGGGDHPPGAAPAGGPPPAMRGDTDGDGVLSRAEFDAQGAAMFDRLDADHDGTITQAEITAMQQQHAAHGAQ